MKTFHADVTVSTGSLFSLERCGKFEEALAELRHIWEDTTNFPEVDTFAPRIAAEIILRCGALIGFFGQIKQIPNSQEKSKNLLTEARGRFLDIYEIEKLVECENYLSLAYVRTGELGEAEDWIEEALSHNPPQICDAWLYSNITKSLILQSLGKYQEILETLLPIEKEFLKFGNPFLLGSFCTNLSLAYKNLGFMPEALKYLESARKYHQKSKHQIYLGTVENNLSQLYKIEKRFDDARKSINNATNIFKKLKDRAREGFSLDTKAQILCEEGKHIEALETINKAVAILNKGENAAFLAESYLSKAKILLHLENSTEAFLSLTDAAHIAKTKIGAEKARNLVKEFEALLEEKRKVVAQTVSERNSESIESLELTLHPTIAHFDDFQGVWINNNYLESFGLRKGSLAVVAKTEIKRGDLAAITELKTGAVMCGFYDSDFGLVCLEGIGEEPRFFDENEIELLGKIIGVGISDDKSKGKINVQPLNT